MVCHTSLKTGISIWQYMLLLLILMHWQQGSDFESKGDQLYFSAEYKIRTQGLWNRIPSRLNAHWWIDWAIEDESENLNSIARLYDQRAFSPFDPTADMASPVALAIYFCWCYVMYTYNMNHIILMSLAKFCFPNTLERCRRHFQVTFLFCKIYLFDNFSSPHAISERVSNPVLPFNIATTLPDRSKWLRGMSMLVL